MNKQRKITVALVTSVLLTMLVSNYLTTEPTVAKETKGKSLYNYNFARQLEKDYKNLSIEKQNLDNRVTNQYLLNNCYNENVKVKKHIKKDKTKISNRWKIKLSKGEINLLANILYLESRGECDEGQQAVVEVIFNRMIYKLYSGTLFEVLSSPNQFSSWKNRNTAHPTKKEYRNIKKVLNGETNILCNNTVFFSTKPRNKKIEYRIGGHYFCNY